MSEKDVSDTFLRPWAAADRQFFGPDQTPALTDLFELAVIVAMPVTRMMEVSLHEIVDMAVARNPLMPAPRAVRVTIREGQQVLCRVVHEIEHRFHITHTTVQVEVEGCEPNDLYCARPQPRRHAVHRHG